MRRGSKNRHFEDTSAGASPEDLTISVGIQINEGVREFKTLEATVGNGLRAVPRGHSSHRNGTEAVPYSLKFPDGLK